MDRSPPLQISAFELAGALVELASHFTLNAARHCPCAACRASNARWWRLYDRLPGEYQAQVDETTAAGGWCAPPRGRVPR